MVNTRFKASKQGDKRKQRVAENPPMGLEGSPVPTSGDNLVGRPTALRFLTTEQLGEVLKQVQEEVIRGVCEQMKAPDQQPRVKRGCDYDPAFEYGSPYQQGQAVP